MPADRGRPPPALTVEAPLALAVRASPACGAPLGGDLYDIVRTPAGPRLVLGDVKGHGPDAAGLAAAVRTAFRETAATEEDPVRLVRLLEDRLRPVLGAEDFVSLLLADFRPDEVRVVNCGHPPPLRVGRRLVPLAPTRPCTPLGLDPGPRVQRAAFLPDQRLLLHTDGLTEARGVDGTMFPLDHRALAALHAPTPDQALEQLLDLVHRHTGRTTTADDLTLIMVQHSSAGG
ncbi:hypothetical protein GCM10010129_01990 [Streptomyces fumigatiscleroticus]|nr:hypothetical protein GCM10010129_01990 [Streptomyces fumigatiscleroticus]